MNITIRNLQENELDEARRIVKLAFGTFLGLPDPMAFGGDASYPHPRWATDAEASFGAFLDDRLIGSNFAVVWGSLGFFGPLTVHPDHWESKTGSQLMQPIMDTFARRNLTHSGLFTFGQSPKHLHLYQKFGFWPRYLTAIGQKEVGQAAPAVEFSRFSRLPAREKESALSAC
ncbi:MAG TPA: GNAT family N-acetyltransferase, partial [Dehalococcoidia bacterium]|nr:GNAT family N-acetyltransferase [Dehalococcoidia bacterium]